jgi:hypothetical protein
MASRVLLRAQQRKRLQTRAGDRVYFKVSDVFLPAAEELHAQIGVTDEVEGRVIGFSDSGMESRVYAVVEIIEKREVIVPINKLRVEGTD